MNTENNNQEFSLESVITAALALPGVKVDRSSFLREQFADVRINPEIIIEKGPVVMGFTRECLKEKADALVLSRTGQSSLASFLTGIPGGLAMAVTIPADIVQFFGVTLRLAQELGYLYGAEDLWKDEALDEEAVRSRLILYCGAMYDLSGAAAGLRLMASGQASITPEDLTGQVLGRTFWYPIVKQTAKAIGVKITRNTLARGLSKAIPILGGVISGGINFASLKPMGDRLVALLDHAIFDYTTDEIQADLEEVALQAEKPEETVEPEAAAPELPDTANEILGSISNGLKQLGNGISDLFRQISAEPGAQTPSEQKDQSPREEVRGDTPAKPAEAPVSSADPFVALEKLARLKETGVITEADFEAKKEEILNRIHF